jgi:hypothetical protein
MLLQNVQAKTDPTIYKQAIADAERETTKTTGSNGICGLGKNEA